MDKESYIAHIKTHGILSPDIVRVSFIKKVPFNPAKKKFYPKQFHRFLDLRAHFCGNATTKKTDINTLEKLARFTRRSRGYGRFSLGFWNPFHKNKKFKPNFRCLFQRGLECPAKTAGKCKIYSVHEPGWSCKVNRKIYPNFVKRAEIIIKPKDPSVYMKDGEPDDFSFEYVGINTLHRMSWWGKDTET